MASDRQTRVKVHGQLHGDERGSKAGNTGRFIGLQSSLHTLTLPIVFRSKCVRFIAGFNVRI